MTQQSYQHTVQERRKNRTRARLRENIEVPRLTVFRSLRHISAQIIDDKKGVTLASANDRAESASSNKTVKAQAVGASLAEQAKGKKITRVRFDKGAYKYHGRVAALADAARKAGLQF